MFPYPRRARGGRPDRARHRRRRLEQLLDLLEEVKLLALLPEAHRRRPVGAARRRGAGDRDAALRSPLLGGTPLAVGEPADFLLLRARDPELAAGDLDADLVYAASGAVVDTTVVAGRVLMRDRGSTAPTRSSRRSAREPGVSPDSVARRAHPGALPGHRRRRPGTTRASI